jgi:phenylacetic acid degradation protein paaN
MIDEAIKASLARTFYSHYPEHPKFYGEDAQSKGETYFKSLLGQPFKLLQPRDDGRCGEETSPYTLQGLGITYPRFTAEKLVTRSKGTLPAWSSVPVRERASILCESLDRMKELFYPIAYATMHTTGQSFIMSFQASGPHAADRALEAVAMGVHQLELFPRRVTWEKPVGKSNVRIEKTFLPIPRGVSVAIGCSTFPVWNTLPSIYASLVTGNPVIVKPHPLAILPMAIVIVVLQETLKANGHDPNICQLAADQATSPITKSLCEHPEVRLIDYTGSSSFGNYIESLPGKISFTEKAGVNSVILESVEDPAAVMQNLAFSLALYSGQMCTAPQNIFIPENGITTSGGKISYENVRDMLHEAVKALAGNPKMGPGTLGTLQNSATQRRIGEARHLGKPVNKEIGIANPEFPEARVDSPVIVETDAVDREIFEKEWFGPVAILVKTKNTDESLSIARELALMHGAITCAAYTTDQTLMDQITKTMNEVFTPVSFNFTGPVWVNQHAAFSDFHVTGGNAAGNASLTNPEFIDKRFVWVGNRYMRGNS